MVREHKVVVLGVVGGHLLLITVVSSLRQQPVIKHFVCLLFLFDFIYKKNKNLYSILLLPLSTYVTLCCPMWPYEVPTSEGILAPVLKPRPSPACSSAGVTGATATTVTATTSRSMVALLPVTPPALSVPPCPSLSLPVPPCHLPATSLLPAAPAGGRTGLGDRRRLFGVHKTDYGATLCCSPIVLGNPPKLTYT